MVKYTLATVAAETETVMLVCHCKVITEHDIRDAIAAGARDEHEIAARCAAGGECGGCLPTIRSLLREAGHEPTGETPPDSWSAPADGPRGHSCGDGLVDVTAAGS